MGRKTALIILHGSKHEVLGESSTCTIFVCQALFLGTNFEDILLCELPRMPLLETVWKLPTDTKFGLRGPP